MPETETPEKPKKGKKGSGILPQGPNIWVQLAIAFAIFLVLSAAYSGLREYWLDSTEEVPLSQIAADIGDGKVSELVVAGDTIKANYNDGSKKESRKESEASFTETLANYGLTPEQFAGVKVTVEDQGGVRYWA
ncbi:MAG: hypothetical protein KGZ69_13645, partial [Methylomonas sp.]|nr:hypothetical protein [Methylomonas sp.]